MGDDDDQKGRYKMSGGKTQPLLFIAELMVRVTKSKCVMMISKADRK